MLGSLGCPKDSEGNELWESLSRGVPQSNSSSTVITLEAMSGTDGRGRSRPHRRLHNNLGQREVTEAREK